MANAIINDNEVFLNGKKYTLKSPVRKRYIDRFPAKINTGADDYDKEQFLSNWIIKDQSGGIGKEEMDESVDADRCWWTNLICDYPGHMLLPRLATAISTFNAQTWTAPTGNSDPSSHWDNEANAYDTNTGTYAQATSIATTSWTGYLILTIASTTVTGFRIWWDENTPNYISDMEVDISPNGTDWTSCISAEVTEGAYVYYLLSATTAVTQVRMRFYNGDGANTATARVHEFAWATLSGSATGTITRFANLGTDKFMAMGTNLLRLKSDRSAYDTVMTTSAAITDLVPSLNNDLYVFCGDSTNYYVVPASGFYFQSDSANAYWGIQYDNKLIKVNTSGACAYSADPYAAAPTWASFGSITDIASEIESFFIGKDADGNDIPYCATNSWLKVLSVPSTGMADATWINSGVKLPAHPNGGKGACYWHDGHYISYGLGVKRYITGSTASISEVGLNKDGGLPLEYNGEIVKFSGDSGMGLMFAAVDTTQVNSDAKSGLYAYTGQGWRCWWAEQYEYASGSNTSTGNIYGSNLKRYQTFTPSISHTIKSFAALLLRLGSPGTITVEIYAVDGSNKPTGAALCSGTTNGNTLPTASPYENRRITLGTGTSLVAGTTYAALISAASGNSSNLIYWVGSSDAGYTGGNAGYTADGGSNWTAETGIDFTFEEYSSGTMGDIIVSSAASSYAVYFVFGNSIIYIDIPRGIASPKQLAGTQVYEGSGIWVSPWFDAGTSAFKKLFKRVRTYAMAITTTETIAIYYRTNRTYTDMTTGWTLLETLNTTGEAGENLEQFASGAGSSISAIQFKLAFARGDTTTNTPDLQALVTSYRKLTTGNWYWSLPIIIDGKHGRTQRQQQEDLEDAVASETDIQMYLRRNDADEPHYVKLSLPSSWSKTGGDYSGEYILEALET